MSIGALADTCNAFAHGVVPYLQILVPVAVKAMSDSDAETRSNATFFAGILMQHGSVTAYPYGTPLLNCANGFCRYYQQVLTNLAKLFSDDSLVNIVDNACGAVARMITAGATAMPLDQVHFIPNVLFIFLGASCIFEAFATSQRF